MRQSRVRQSTPQQVAENQESTARQYALVGRPVDLGWPRDNVKVIDDDLGRSGQSAEARPRFHQLLAEVALDHVGLVLALDVSPLARCCKETGTSRQRWLNVRRDEDGHKMI